MDPSWVAKGKRRDSFAHEHHRLGSKEWGSGGWEKVQSKRSASKHQQDSHSGTGKTRETANLKGRVMSRRIGLHGGGLRRCTMPVRQNQDDGERKHCLLEKALAAPFTKGAVFGGTRCQILTADGQLCQVGRTLPKEEGGRTCQRCCRRWMRRQCGRGRREPPMPSERSRTSDEWPSWTADQAGSRREAGTADNL